MSNNNFILKFHQRFRLTPARFVYIFSIFNGLAYYAFILCISSFLPFEKGFIRFAISLFFFVISVLLAYQNRITLYTNFKKGFPTGIKILIFYFLWVLLSFSWSQPENYDAQGFNISTFYFAQWINYVIEFLTILLMCLVCPVQKLSINYFKGLQLGGFILASTYLIVWFFILKSARLSVFGSGVEVIHPNMLALKLAISALCSLHLYFTRESKNIVKMSFLVAPIVFAMILTVGKTVLIGFFVALLYYILKLKRTTNIKLVVFTIIFSFIALAIPNIIDYITNYYTTGTIFSLSGRTDLWQVTWEECFSKPIFGHGVASPFPTMVWSNLQTAGHSGTAHNEYLNAFYEMGIIGIFIIFIVYFSFFRNALISLKRNGFETNGILCMSIFILMFTVSLTASYPIGFTMPIALQVIFHFWMSKKWAKPNTSSQAHNFPHLRKLSTMVESF